MDLSRRALGVAALSALVVAGCSGGDGLPASQGQNYIEGDGTTVQWEPGERREPVEFTGTAVDGTTVDLAQYRGKVVVLNTWFAGCAPCRAEARDVESVWQQYRDRNVQFLGVNTYDTAAIAQSFQESFSITYPSVLDAGSGAAMLALRAYSPQATPTTLVLDTDGRVAARVSGIVRPLTLSGLLDDAGADPAPGPGASPSASAPA
ncbi:TlpA family protein disulfide reductase [Kineococcus aurantiacus]|uniref:Peroxiredoxin n=1 Tax=Kineococcus aurantiacus TaxID=37633 RepID=A0A7Y9DK70_9ACTN|nr:TlpA disulfide reductase family protein [Kineococcus aurantiacus]NYD22114.1 peroxiredoxin [Kineococcus aurantiacus]